MPRARIRFWSILILATATAIGWGLWPTPIGVDLYTITAQPLQVTVTEEGKTQVRDVYQVSAPINGYVKRIQVEVGDVVEAGVTALAEIEPVDPNFLDPRSEAQTQADVKTAASARDYAKAQLHQAQVELDFASKDLRRVRELSLSGTASERELDEAQRLVNSRRAALDTAQAALQMRIFELERVKASLLAPTQASARQGHCECMQLYAPVNGRVLAVQHESEGVVPAGEPLLAVGDPADIEILAELLSTDAVKVKPGHKVLISNWGGEALLTGQVNRIDPVGFTKVSALGIEEQRVNVMIDLVSPQTQWQRLGHGYQVDVAIVLWEAEQILSVPLTALFREGDGWQVYALEQGRAQPRPVVIGRQNHQFAQVVEGLNAGEQIVLYPSNQIGAGVRVTQRLVESTSTTSSVSAITPTR